MRNTRHGAETMTVYHVCFEWDGDDLKPLSQQVDESGDLEAAITMVAMKWTDGDRAAAERYIDEDGRAVHFHATLAQALEYLEEWCDGGMILEVDAADLEIKLGKEYAHPVVYGTVPAASVRVLSPA